MEAAGERHGYDALLTPEQVAKRLNTSIDWVWDHSSRKLPLLPVIRIGSGPGRSGILRVFYGRIGYGSRKSELTEIPEVVRKHGKSGKRQVQRR